MARRHKALRQQPRATSSANAGDHLVNRIKPIRAGQPPEIVGATLADLLAIWLASHIFPSMPSATAEMREVLLQTHIMHVRELMVENAKILGTGGEHLH